MPERAASRAPEKAPTDKTTARAGKRRAAGTAHGQNSKRSARDKRPRDREHKRLRSLDQCQCRVIEQVGPRAAHDAGVMHAAVTVDAEGQLRHPLFAPRARLGRISLGTFELGNQQ